MSEPVRPIEHFPIIGDDGASSQPLGQRRFVFSRRADGDWFRLSRSVSGEIERLLMGMALAVQDQVQSDGGTQLSKAIGCRHGRGGAGQSGRTGRTRPRPGCCHR